MNRKKFEEDFCNEIKSKFLYDYINDKYKPKTLITCDFVKALSKELMPCLLYPFVISDFYSRFLRMKGYNVLYLNGINDISEETFKLINENNIDFSNIGNNFKDNFDKLNISYDSKYFFTTEDEPFIKECDLFFSSHFNKDIFYGLTDAYITALKDKVYNLFDLTKEDNRYFSKDNEEVFKTKSTVCYLDFKSHEEEVITQISKLNLDKKYIDQIFETFDIYYTLQIPFYINDDLILNVETKNPEYLAGISFIALNPNYMDIFKYVSEEELEFVRDFVDNKEIGYIYSGYNVPNPLSGEDIYIFISFTFEEAIHLGIPSINEEDFIFNNNLGLEYKVILDGEKLINSDFLNGLNVLEAKETIENAFIAEGLAKKVKHLGNTKIIISNFESAGLPIPLENIRGGKIKTIDTICYPIRYNKFLKLLFKENLNRPVDTINLNFNDAYVNALFDLYLSDKKLYFNDSSFLNNKVNIINEDNIFTRIVLPLIFKIVDNREIKEEKYIIYDKKIDKSYINKMNNLNVNFISDVSSDCSFDAIRIYVLFKQDESLEQCVNETSKIDMFLDSIVQKFDEGFSYENLNLSGNLYALALELEKLANKLEYKEYYLKLEWFFNNKIRNYAWSEEDALKFVKLLCVIAPNTSELLFRYKFMSRDYLMFETFPTS